MALQLGALRRKAERLAAAQPYRALKGALRLLPCSAQKWAVKRLFMAKAKRLARQRYTAADIAALLDDVRRQAERKHL
jgi:hypothetical protein